MKFINFEKNHKDQIQYVNNYGKKYGSHFPMEFMLSVIYSVQQQTLIWAVLWFIELESYFSFESYLQSFWKASTPGTWVDLKG